MAYQTIASFDLALTFPFGIAVMLIHVVSILDGTSCNINHMKPNSRPVWLNVLICKPVNWKQALRRENHTSERELALGYASHFVKKSLAGHRRYIHLESQLEIAGVDVLYSVVQ